MTTLAAKALARIAALRKEQAAENKQSAATLDETILVDQDIPSMPTLYLAAFNTIQMYELPLSEIQNQYTQSLQQNKMSVSH